MHPTFKRSLSRVAPKPAVRMVDRLRLYRESLIDARHFAASSSRDGTVTMGSKYADPTFQLEGQVVRAYHQIEKGFTLPTPRRPFGKRVQERLVQSHEVASQRGLKPPSWHVAEEALQALAEYNSGSEIPDAIAHSLGCDPVQEDLRIDALERFFSQRHSIRSFDRSRTVEDEVLLRAADLAGRSPSVCNRRPWRVRFVRSRTMIDKALDLQHGAGGFSQDVPVVAVVSFERSLFSGRGERHQGYVDSGMFAMNLVWGLEAQGVGTCFLNWSKTNSESDALRALCGIPDSEDIEVLVALGYRNESCRVSRSPRREVSDFVRLL